MNLNFKFLKSVSTIYDEMVHNGFSMVYLGEFSAEITGMFTAMTENNLSKQGDEKSVKKRGFHVMVEVLQNLNKHSDELKSEDPSKDQSGNGLFIVGRIEDTYYIITSNKVSKERRDLLESAIKQVNSATHDELKQMYLKQIKEGQLSSKGGAGLGLIDIARKTGKRLNYQFIELDSEYYFFILQVEISGKTAVKE